MIYGYARASTDGQSVEAQRDQLAIAGASKVFCEAASGRRARRADAWADATTPRCSGGLAEFERDPIRRMWRIK